jgi:hypothetical protein
MLSPLTQHAQLEAAQCVSAQLGHHKRLPIRVRCHRHCVSLVSRARSLAGTTGVDWVMHPSTAFVLLRFGSCYDNGNNADFGQYAFPSVRVVCAPATALAALMAEQVQPKLVDSRENQLRQVSGLRALGAFQIPVSFSGGANTWYRITQNYGLGFSFNHYTSLALPGQVCRY